jgi:glycosyltransferase involved in cell wall biosynthesis
VTYIARRSGRSRFSPDRLNIVVSTPTFLPVVGGAELGIHEIYTRIGARHNVTIITPQLPRHLVADYGADDYQTTNYRVIRLASRMEGSAFRPVARALRKTSFLYTTELARLVHRRQVDVINFHYIAPHGVALVLAKYIAGIPVALSLVGRPDVLSALSFTKRLYGHTVLASADAVLPISAYYLRDASPSRARTRVIPYGVNIDQFTPAKASTTLRASLGIARDQPMLLCVQRLTRVKRVDMLIRVLADVVLRQPNAVLVIVGQGSEEAPLRALVNDLRLGDNVRFTSYVTGHELPIYFASADLFVFHSMFETFGIVFAQAMASALPIVAANTSCVPDVVTPANGELVPPGDVHAFSEAIIQLLEQPDRRSAIGISNRTRAEQEFNWDVIADDYEGALRRVIGRGPP